MFLMGVVKKALERNWNFLSGGRNRGPTDSQRQTLYRVRHVS